jgi:urease accessory protein
MEQFTSLLAATEPGEPSVTLSLAHDQRRRAKLRVVLPDGSAVGLSLPRGLALKDGDRLRADASGALARVRAAQEHVSVVATSDPWLLARAAYHLGNRHVVLCVEPGRLSYPHDHVLDGMCRELGLAVSAELRPFEPEAGGYADHSHGSLLRPATSARRHG